MREGKGASIMDYFETLEDPRIDRCKRHKLLDIIAIAICAVICGADSWVYIELFGKSRLEWFQTFLELPHGIPSHDTPAFAGTGSSATSSPGWTRSSSSSASWPGPRRCPTWSPGRWWPSTARRYGVPTTAIRASGPSTPYRGTGQALVSAWASANTLTPVSGTGQALGQVKTEEKSNEITAIPQLLQMLELKGCIVTIDAMGCQKDIAQGILDRGADYVLALKENQGQLYEDVRDLFEGAEEFGFEGVPHDYATTLNKNHGRIERRECWTISDPSCLEYLSTGQDWPSLRSVVKVVGRRETPEETTVQPRYYISSLDAPAERLLEVVCTHWSIENSLHWSLDVTFGEDQCRVRKSLPS